MGEVIKFPKPYRRSDEVITVEFPVFGFMAGDFPQQIQWSASLDPTAWAEMTPVTSEPTDG